MSNIIEADANLSVGAETVPMRPTPRDYLTELLQKRLHECGWYEKVRRMVHCELTHRGINNLTYNDIHQVVLPKAVSLVPDELPKELRSIVQQSLRSSYT